ncbi:MAG: hypothetical protein JNK82_20155 [Myxococcaceae bacterium]|nr:hypothetical protein [Myxococcaceae bacterium]
MKEQNESAKGKKLALKKVSVKALSRMAGGPVFIWDTITCDCTGQISACCWGGSTGGGPPPYTAEFTCAVVSA